MEQQAVEAQGLTYDFGGGKGVFLLAFTVARGEVLGFLGPNGAGKTTTMRLLTGLIRPQAGTARILEADCWARQDATHRSLGYLPGEIAMPRAGSGRAVLDLLADMRGIKDRSYEKSLIERFELDVSASPKKLSKGNRQKLGLVAALQHDPEVLLLDEPTSGFDPIMQERFVEWVLEEKGRGKAILLSSHQFPEVERTADRVAVLREGRIAALRETTFLSERSRRSYRLRFASTADAVRFGSAYPPASVKGAEAEVLAEGSLRPMISALQGLELVGLEERHQGLEDAFLQIYVPEGGRTA